MKKTFFVLALIGLVFMGQAPVSQAAVDDSIYSVGFNSLSGKQGYWRTMPDQVSFFLACPNGYRGNEDDAGMISGKFKIERRDIFYCWLPRWDEKTYSARVGGRALYGGTLPIIKDSYGPQPWNQAGKELSPLSETFNWKIQYWNQSKGEFDKKNVTINGFYYDAIFEKSNAADTAQNALIDALAANGFGETTNNTAPPGISYFKGYEKKADDHNGFLTCKITRKLIRGSESKFIAYVKKQSTGWQGGGGGTYYHSVRVSCGYFQK